MSFQISKLKDAINLDPDVNTDIAVKVLQRSDAVEYKNKANQDRKYYTLVVADESAHCVVRNYNAKLMSLLTVGKNVLIKNVLKKMGEHSLWIVSTSKVFDWATVQVPQHVVDASMAPAPARGEEITSLEKAIISPSTSKVVAKIVQISPLKHRRNGELLIKFFSECGPRVKVALFGEDATREYSQGEVVSISDTYKWKNSQTLSTKKTSHIEFLSPDSVKVDMDGLPLCDDDDDFKEDTATSQEPEDFTVMGISSAHVYKCCPNTGCRNKKLEDGKCPSCKATSLTREKWYCAATLIFQRGQLFEQHRLFYDDLKQLFALPDLKNANVSGNLNSCIIAQLPVNGHGIFSGKGVSITTCKRSLSS